MDVAMSLKARVQGAQRPCRGLGCPQKSSHIYVSRRRRRQKMDVVIALRAEGLDVDLF